MYLFKFAFRLVGRPGLLEGLHNFFFVIINISFNILIIVLELLINLIKWKPGV